MLRKQIGRYQVNVFTFNGKLVHQVNTKAWHKALARVGIENFRWHDLRHIWASWHIQEGIPLHVLQELGGCQRRRWCRSMRIYRVSILHNG
ncbi:tyrosine-type recombinase/integrase [Candidatus Nitrotoga sp. HW29]|uniref:tyrosine-type recombinase/integrase n=1 Tax=Candidatus Nitrotoga sp. HW29 TaxID=2886963 RepID=UPI002A4E2702|nr:tyrosine-type recombinase/integrase [Candidatus Nitrotoga sp. HW29]